MKTIIFDCAPSERTENAFGKTIFIVSGRTMTSRNASFEIGEFVEYDSKRFTIVSIGYTVNDFRDITLSKLKKNDETIDYFRHIRNVKNNKIFEKINCFKNKCDLKKKETLEIRRKNEEDYGNPISGLEL